MPYYTPLLTSSSDEKKNVWLGIRERKMKEKRMATKAQKREIETKGVISASFIEFARLSYSLSTSTRSSSRAPSVWASQIEYEQWEKIDQEIRKTVSTVSDDRSDYSLSSTCPSSPSLSSHTTSPTPSSSSSSSHSISRWELDLEWKPLFSSTNTYC